MHVSGSRGKDFAWDSYRKKRGSGLLVRWVGLLELPKLGLRDQNGVMGLN